MGTVLEIVTICCITLILAAAALFAAHILQEIFRKK